MVIRQSTACTIIIGPILDASGVAVTDGVVGDIKISKNGAAPAALNGSATLTHRHSGVYSLALTTTDTNTVGTAQITIDDGTNAMAPKDLQVVEEAIYDAFYASSATGLLPANVTQIAGASVSTSSAQIGVNVVNAGGTAWATVVTNLVSSIWSATTRILTAGTNIVLAKGTGVTGFTDLDAAGVRTAVGLSSANLDTQLSTIDSVVDGIKAVTDNLPENGALTSIADDVADALAASEAARDRLVAEPITTGEVVSDGGNSSTAIKTDLSETADGHWVGAYLLITSGDLEGQVKRITGYDGTDKIVTTDAFTSTPADGTAFAIINR